MTNKKRAAGYTRVSGKLQVKGQSLPNQRRRITEYIQAGGYELTQIYEEKGITGDTISQRPALQQCLAAADAGEIDVLVLTKMSRLSRKRTDYDLLKRAIQEAGCEIHFLDDDLSGMDENMGDLMEGIKISFNQFEKNENNRAMAEGKTEKAGRRIGPCSGPAAYGFRYTGPRGNRVLEPDPDEQPTLQHMKRLRRTGYSYHKIADILNTGSEPYAGDIGVQPTRRGGKWYAQSVKGVLTSLHAQSKFMYQGKVHKIKKQAN